jgi:hypothetical protein
MRRPLFYFLVQRDFNKENAEFAETDFSCRHPRERGDPETLGPRFRGDDTSCLLRVLAHRVFGLMTVADWQRWAYKHADHHLRQFGL